MTGGRGALGGARVQRLRHTGAVPVPIRIVDAFADAPFSGNPAAVCLLGEERDEGWYRAVAAEVNLSETAFLVPSDDRWSLRWFTPIVEVDLCGHATLASAHVLWAEGRERPGATIVFATRSGELRARQLGDGTIELDLPANVAEETEVDEALARALGTRPVRSLRRPEDLVAVLDSAAAVRACAPDLRAVRELGVDGVIVTSRGDAPGTDYVLRYFAPGAGIDEDPVTGYAQTVIGPFWADELGRDTLEAHQVSPRGGRLRVTVDGERVRVAGRAVTVLTGALLDP